MAEYEKLAWHVDLSITAVKQALQGVGFLLPTLTVNIEEANAAIEIARIMGLGIRLEPKRDLEPGEWYVEWHGRRVGSGGE